MGLKPTAEQADLIAMDLPSTTVLLINAFIAGAVILGVMSIFASKLGHACDIHDLKRECKNLEEEYARRLDALKGKIADESIEVELVSDIRPKEAPPIAA